LKQKLLASEFLRWYRPQCATRTVSICAGTDDDGEHGCTSKVYCRCLVPHS